MLYFAKTRHSSAVAVTAQHPYDKLTDTQCEGEPKKLKRYTITGSEADCQMKAMVESMEYTLLALRLFVSVLSLGQVSYLSSTQHSLKFSVLTLRYLCFSSHYFQSNFC